MTQTMAPVKISPKQHNYIVDLTAKRPNWISVLAGDVYETVVTVLINNQVQLNKKINLADPGIEEFVSLKQASAAISALLAIKPTPTVATPPAQPKTLKEVATNWINEQAAPAPEVKKAPVPSDWQRLRRMLATLPDGAHIKFALTNAQGVVEFFSVDEVKSKYKTGETYRTIRKLSGSPGGWNRTYLSVAQQLGTARQLLSFGWEQACKDYAIKHERCCRCDAHLSDERSRAAKVGEKCAEIWGWPW